MHIHIGVQQALITFATVVVVGFFWRVTAARLHNTSVGRAMAFIY